MTSKAQLAPLEVKGLIGVSLSMAAENPGVAP